MMYLRKGGPVREDDGPTDGGDADGVGTLDDDGAEASTTNGGTVVTGRSAAPAPVLCWADVGESAVGVPLPPRPLPRPRLGARSGTRPPR